MAKDMVEWQGNSERRAKTQTLAAEIDELGPKQRKGRRNKMEILFLAVKNIHIYQKQK